MLCSCSGIQERRGLFLEHFLLDKDKVVDWLSFQRAFFNMRRAYCHLCGEDLGVALGDFLYRLQEIFVAYPQIEMKTLLFLTEMRLGRLRKMVALSETVAALEISAIDLQTALQMELYHRQAMPVKKLAAPAGGTKRTIEDADEAPERGGAQPVKKTLSRKPPSLAGAHPCWNWILKRGGCNGSECKSKSKMGKLMPRPHAFDGADKGLAEEAYRAWVKKHNVGKD